MATTSLMTIEAYGKASFHPDVEFVDGELKERNVGKYEHARIQLLLAAWFRQNEAIWNLQGVTEQRMRLAEAKVRIPDVALLPPGRQPDVIEDAPVLVVEILSPDDGFADVVVKIREYLHWGVNTVWIIGPDSAEGQMWTASRGCTFSSTLIVSGTKIQIDLATLFEQLKQS